MLKKLLVVFSLIFFVLLVAVLAVDRRFYAAYVEEQITSLAKAQNIPLSLKGFDLFFLGVRAENLETFIKQTLTPVNLGSVEVQTATTSLFKFNPSFTVSGKLYGGEVLAEIQSFPRSNSVTISKLAINDVRLALHPQLQALGVNKGILRASLERAKLMPQQVEAESLSLEIIDLEKPGSSMVPAFITGLPLDLNIPPVMGLSIKLRGIIKGGALRVSECTGKSNLASFKNLGDWTIALNKRTPNLKFEARMDLTDEGLALVGQWLPVISQQKLSANARSFRIAGSGSLERPKINFERL